MGTVIKRRDFTAVVRQARQGVFVLAQKLTVPIDAPAVNVGMLLGEAALTAKSRNAPIDIAHTLDTILGQESHDIILENTDILFSPEYGLDVIKMLLQIGRNQRFYLMWPGEITGDKLTYSEPDMFDYKEYNIKDYVDTYVVLR